MWVWYQLKFAISCSFYSHEPMSHKFTFKLYENFVVTLYYRIELYYWCKPYHFSHDVLFFVFRHLYKWFLLIYKISYFVGICGYVIMMATFLGLHFFFGKNDLRTVQNKFLRLQLIGLLIFVECRYFEKRCLGILYQKFKDFDLTNKNNNKCCVKLVSGETN